MALVSISVPVYNVENYLSRCLDSLINQTFEDIEIICVNDGSTDNSSIILNQYQKMDKRIRIINQENQGLSVVREVGIAEARGKYMMFVDADDFISTNAVELLYKKCEETQADMVIFNYGCSRDNGQFSAMMAGVDESYEDKVFSAWDVPPEFFMFTPIFTWAKMYRLDFIKDIKFDVGRVCQDIGFYAQAFVKAKRIAYVSAVLYNYLVTRSDSTTNSVTKRKFSDVLFEYQRAIDVFKEANLYEKYRQTVNRMIVADTLKKLASADPGLKPQFFSDIKAAAFDIDTEELKQYNDYPRERQNYDLFEILQKVETYSDFYRRLEEKYGKRS